MAILSTYLTSINICPAMISHSVLVVDGSLYQHELSGSTPSAMTSQVSSRTDLNDRTFQQENSPFILS